VALAALERQVRGVDRGALVAVAEAGAAGLEDLVLDPGQVAVLRRLEARGRDRVGAGVGVASIVAATGDRRGQA
jgi:hypothetical protein